MVNWKCRKCGTDFEARSSYIDWRSGEHVDPKCPGCNSYAVKTYLDQVMFMMTSEAYADFPECGGIRDIFRCELPPIEIGGFPT